ncbi:MAG: DUF4878 domain-containing protein [Bacteroidales bacterium]|nr:DUF4878 domain-containing protein [Bacteroidales bacterium]MCF8386741.1 DUF4878 domain-containing protein [Bacteroidales bacterium]MCF8397263.1 DUF4878 domain-containing protein [Bacteroidales bacterium]
MKKVNILLGLTVAVTILFFAACGGGSSSSSPSGVVEAYYDAFQSGDYEGMIMLFEGSENYSADKVKKNAEMLKMGVEAQKKATGGIKKFSVIEENIDDAGDAAIVKIKTVYKDDSEEESEMELVKVNGKWMFKKLF